MKRISFNLEVRETDNGFPIYIRMTQNKQHKRIRTAISLKSKKDWNPRTQRISTSEPNSVQWNSYLKKEKDKIENIYLEDTNVSLDALYNKIQNNESSKSFVQFANAYSVKMLELGKSNAKQWISWCRKLEGYLKSLNRKDISFSELDYTFVQGYESYLRLLPSEKGEGELLSQNYILTLMKRFSTLVNRAVKEGLIQQDKNPFIHYKKPKEEQAHKDALTLDEVKRVLGLEYEKDSRLYHAKNFFLFSVYCCGMRVADALQLRWSNIVSDNNGDSSLRYVMNKNGKYNEIPLVPHAMSILSNYKKKGCKDSDYIFPMLDSKETYAQYSNRNTMPIELKQQLQKQIYSKTTLINSHLKQIAFDAKLHIENLSTHINRHTFASMALTKNVNIKQVQEFLGHSSLEITQRYLHSLKGTERGELNNIFSDL